MVYRAIDVYSFDSVLSRAGFLYVYVLWFNVSSLSLARFLTSYNNDSRLVKFSDCETRRSTCISGRLDARAIGFQLIFSLRRLSLNFGFLSDSLFFGIVEDIFLTGAISLSRTI